MAWLLDRELCSDLSQTSNTLDFHHSAATWHLQPLMCSLLCLRFGTPNNAFRWHTTLRLYSWIFKKRAFLKGAYPFNKTDLLQLLSHILLFHCFVIYICFMSLSCHFAPKWVRPHCVFLSGSGQNMLAFLMTDFNSHFCSHYNKYLKVPFDMFSYIWIVWMASGFFKLTIYNSSFKNWLCLVNQNVYFLIWESKVWDIFSVLALRFSKYHLKHR